MIIAPRNRKRRAFTLLEVLLASLIAILLLAALYFAMDVTLRQTQESRDAVDVDNLSRGVYTRMTLDLSASLGPLPPKSGGNAASSTSSTPTSDPSMMATTDPSMMTTPTASAPSATTTTTPTDPSAAATPAVDPATGEAAATPQAADIGFQAGIIGTDKQLTVFASRLPSMMTSARGLSDTSGAQLPSDLVRITYWISQNGGLCRQERPWVTADGVRNSSDPDLTDEAGDTLVQEVSDVTFEYFHPKDGWMPSWDGSQMSPDGVTPIGPPRAVKVTLVYSIPSTRRGDPPFEHTVVQVIPVRSAPGGMTPEMITPSTDPGATTADTSGMNGTTNMNPTSNTGMGNSSTAGAGAGAGAASSGTRPTGGTTPTTPSGGTRPTGGTTPTTPSGGTRPAGGAAPPTSGGTRPSAGASPSTMAPPSANKPATTAPSNTRSTTAPSSGTRGGGK